MSVTGSGEEKVSYPAPAGAAASLQNLIFESDAFGVVCLEPALRSLGISERLDVIRMANAASGVERKSKSFSI